MTDQDEIRALPDDHCSHGASMARARELARSSYDKVYVALACTDEGRRCWDAAVRYYQELDVQDYAFRVSGANVEAVHVDYKIRGISDKDLQASYLDSTGSWLDAWRGVPKPTAWDAVYHHFGKGVPTYNVDKAQVLGEQGWDALYPTNKLAGRKLSKVSCSKQKEFYSWLCDWAYARMARLRLEAYERVSGQVAALQQDPEFLRRRKEAQVRQCMEDVKRTLSNYAALGDETLREAVRSYVVDDVMGL